MKFNCNQQALAKALTTVSKAVSNRTTLPILKGIMIEAASDGKMILTASDLEISIKKEIEAVIEEPGSVVVVSRLFGDIVRKLPNETIFFEEDDEDNSITIKTDTSEFKVVCLPVDEFPKVGEKEEPSETIYFDREIFKDMVRKTSFAASIEESKGILTGILTEINEEYINMVSLDGFRLALVNEKVKSKKAKKFIVSAKVMNEISKIVTEEEEGDIKIDLGEKKALFNIGKTEVVLRLMEGEFIKYRDIIPTENTTKITSGREILLESIERASLLAKEGKNNLIKMSLKNDLLTITSRSEEGNVKEKIVVEKEGNDIEIGFNSKFIIDVLKVIDEEIITMNFKTGLTPCVVKPVEGNAYEYLILSCKNTCNVMYIKEIELKDFRNYKKQRISFNKKVNIFIGNNAQGKTNLLEGIYFNAIGKSFKNVRDKELIRFGEEYFKIKTTSVIDNEENITETVVNREGYKGIKINGIKISKPHSFLKKYI